jgi:hypothetical protein
VAEIAADYSTFGLASSLTPATNAFGGASSALSMTTEVYAVSKSIIPVLPSSNAARTSSVWVKSTACSQDPFGQYVYAWGDGSGGGKAWAQILTHSGYSYLWGQADDWGLSTDLCDGRWHHLTFTLDGVGGPPRASCPSLCKARSRWATRRSC